MIKRWPIRLRLTAAFALTMALILTGVAVGTVTNSRASLDESITETLQYRLRDVQSAAEAVSPVLPGGRDSAEQILDANQQVVAGSREVAGQVLLSPWELAGAQHGPIMVEHPGAGTLAGPVRIAASRAASGSRIAVAAVSLADRDAAVGDLARELAVAFPLVLVAAAAGAYLLTAGSLRPVERMRARAATITAENPEQRLPLPASRDEISRLGSTFNDLLARLHRALNRERQFVTDASHELRTPLSLLTTELELALQRTRSRDELTSALRSALEETERLSRLAQDLLLLARTDRDHHPANVELHPLLRSLVDRYRIAASGPDVTLDCPPDLAVRVNRDDLDRAVSNLLDNALQHAATPITIHAHRTRADDNGRVAIEVRDHGPGIDPEFLPHAFDRFTRADTSRTSEGAGLGLAITAALAHRNGGHVTATNADGGGAVLALTFPTARASARPQQEV
ncbi:sensor histidine kinase [Saccharopolyspora phatthalungensis]|uniref:histidine kinase n=1 Tax=Saccharopolyspora phatthalungensis TaxID=664693 RepID=A0A840QGH3_9PSEU|nr:ATP-binding protein [Saccharopolyspora phatthalungensis]MBB5159060.1 signal transduction histidine kinase [Saccharopolyspora phatthalungensis]